MKFRSKLFLVFTVALLLSVGLIATGVTIATRRAFEESNRRNTDASIGQFKRELDRRAQDVVQRVQGIADAEATVRMAIDLSRPQADVSVYVNDARGVSESHQLDFLDFAGNDGSIISSAEYPARFGYKMDWVAGSQADLPQDSFLMKLDTQDGPAVGRIAVKTVRVGDKNLYVVGGERLGKDFLASLALPAGMRALLYLNLDSGFETANMLDQSGPVDRGERFAGFIDEQRRVPSERTFKISWTADTANSEEFHTLPLLGRNNELLGVLLVASSQRQLVMLERRIRLLALAAAAIGLFFALLLSWWGAARVTRPVAKLVEGAREVSAGNWNARVDVRGRGEMGQLGRAFNSMTEQLSEQRSRLVQAERVASWRELARRLAHELKNPLFPLQTTVENLQRSKQQGGEEFEETFRESSGILLAEIANLKIIASRFSDFARMPQPELAPVNLNDVVRAVVKLFEAQFSAVGRPPIASELHLDEQLPSIQADAVLLHRAIENLVLNAMDAMPGGGVLMLRTTHENGDVDVEISDTGTGLAREECERLFTPYYTTKQHGTGLGLAIVQSIVSDHGGRITVESETNVGTSFHIHLFATARRSAVASSPDMLAVQPSAIPSTKPAEATATMSLAAAIRALEKSKPTADVEIAAGESERTAPEILTDETLDREARSSDAIGDPRADLLGGALHSDIFAPESALGAISDVSDSVAPVAVEETNAGRDIQASPASVEEATGGGAPTEESAGFRNETAVEPPEIEEVNREVETSATGTLANEA